MICELTYYRTEKKYWIEKDCNYSRFLWNVTEIHNLGIVNSAVGWRTNKSRFEMKWIKWVSKTCSIWCARNPFNDIFSNPVSIVVSLCLVPVSLQGDVFVKISRRQMLGLLSSSTWGAKTKDAATATTPMMMLITCNKKHVCKYFYIILKHFECDKLSKLI